MAVQGTDKIALSRSGIIGKTTAQEIANLSKTKGIFQHGGRVYCYADNRWISSFDDNYGSFTENQSESGGKGVTSLNEWEWQGGLLPNGAVLRSLTMIGRANNVQITDMNIVLSSRIPSPVSRWETGFDADSEDVVTEIANLNWWDSANWSGAMNDKHKRTFDLGDFVWDGNAEFHLSFKPIGTLTATRYFYTTWMMEYEF